MADTRHYLGVDIGNSGLRIAELDLANQKLLTSTRISWRHEIKLDASTIPSESKTEVESPEPATRFYPHSQEWLGQIEHYLSKESIQGPCDWLIGSVRRDAENILEQFVTSRTRDSLRRISLHDLSLKVDVLQPEQVGIDRLLAASAAAGLFRERPLIVMQVGSAMTVDIVSKPNVFRGGAILPGVPMMLRLLGQAADLLPQIEAEELIELPALPGRDTEQAMRCGTASALVGGAQHLVNRYRNLYGTESLVVISGGDGMRLSQHIEPPIKVVPHLVLQGLIPIADRRGASQRR
jgi:type III pantothenate kinase